MKKLELLMHAVLDDNYDWATCVIHALYLMLQWPIESVLGSGGIKKRAFMQMLPIKYTFKSLYPMKVWRIMWHNIIG